MKSDPASRACGSTDHKLPVAELDGAQIYSLGWVSESPLTFSIWWELPSGATALQTLTLGAPLGQDLTPRIVSGPDR
jgi:hypothetical protein